MFAVLSILLSSCAVSNSISIGESKYFDVYCHQILDDNAVLAAWTEDGISYGVKIITNGVHYSRWQSIKGFFTCIDYWTYETVEGIINTVPVVIETSEYESYKKQRGY